MGYYVRVFCASSEVPALADVLEWVSAQGTPVWVDPENIPAEEETVKLGEGTVGILYKEGKLSFLVEVNKKDGEESLYQEEIDEFFEFLDDVRKSKKKDKVIQHLQSTQYIVACQLPTSDMDDDGYEAVGWFLQYFARHCEGMIQCDGEGFYDERNKLIVELE